MWNSAMMEHYDPSSEITVLAVCLVMLLLLAVSFKVRMKSFRIFVSMLGLLMLYAGIVCAAGKKESKA